MPRVRRVFRSRREWPPGAVFQLLSGIYIVGGLAPGTDRETLRAAWGELRGRVFAELEAIRLRSGGNYPLLRPVAWWWFDSPELRDHEISEADQLARLGLLDDDDPADGSLGLVE